MYILFIVVQGFGWPTARSPIGYVLGSILFGIRCPLFLQANLAQRLLGGQADLGQWQEIFQKWKQIFQAKILRPATLSAKSSTRWRIHVFNADVLIAE